MSYIGKVNIGNGNLPIAASLFGTCITAASTAAKVVTCSDFDTLIDGIEIRVWFKYGNTAEGPTLNVNSTGAKDILITYSNSSPDPPHIWADGDYAESWSGGRIVSFTYHGGYWVLSDGLRDYATTSNGGLMSASDKGNLERILTKEVAYATGSISLASNSNVSPYSTFGSSSVTIPTGYIPIAAMPIDNASTNPVILRCSDNGTVLGYGRSAATVNYRVLLMKGS